MAGKWEKHAHYFEQRKKKARNAKKLRMWGGKWWGEDQANESLMEIQWESKQKPIVISIERMQTRMNVSSFSLSLSLSFSLLSLGMNTFTIRTCMNFYDRQFGSFSLTHCMCFEIHKKYRYACVHMSMIVACSFCSTNEERDRKRVSELTVNVIVFGGFGQRE